MLWIGGSGDGTGSGVAGYRRQREVHGACLATASRRCIGTGRCVSIGLVTVAVRLDVQTLLVGVPGADKRCYPRHVGGSRWRENHYSGCQSCQCDPVHLCCHFYESEWLDGGIAADEHAVPGAIVGEANAVVARHDRPALDVVGLARDQGVKRGMVVTGADVRTPVAKLS